MFEKYIKKNILTFTNQQPYWGKLEDYEIYRNETLLINKFYFLDNSLKILITGSSALRDALSEEKIKLYFESIYNQPVDLVMMTIENGQSFGESFFTYNAIKTFKPNLILWGIMPPIYFEEKIQQSYVFKTFATREFCEFTDIPVSFFRKILMYLKRESLLFRVFPILIKKILSKLFKRKARTYLEIFENHMKAKSSILEEEKQKASTIKYQDDKFWIDTEKSQLYFKMFDFIKQNKIPFYYFNVPVSDLQLKKYERVLCHFINDIKNKYKDKTSMTFIDLPLSLDLENFYDLAHLHPEGKNKFTDFFLEEFSKVNRFSKKE